MGLTLGTALRLRPRSTAFHPEDGAVYASVAFVGAGGKTTALFKLARELPVRTLVACTTHLGAWQLGQADEAIVARTPADLSNLGAGKITVVTGPLEAGQRLSSVAPEILAFLRQRSLASGWPLLIEADGARERPLKAPREREPQLPPFVEMVVVVAGLQGLGRPLDGDSVHRPEVFGRLAGIEPGSPITGRSIGTVLAHPEGGQKEIPARARRVALLNQADTPELQAEAHHIARQIGGSYDGIVVAALREDKIYAVHEPRAGIVLAAGGARRFGGLKQMLPWRGEPLVRTAILAAVKAGLSPIVLGVGAGSEDVEQAVSDLPVVVAKNSRWEMGQSSSIQAGVDACPPSICAAVFLLADQPYIGPELVRALVDAHASETAAIVAPLIQGDRPGNPVLFDRETFPELRALQGDTGGRAVFSKHRVHYVPWHDDRIARDIDTTEDYRRLLEEDHP